MLHIKQEYYMNLCRGKHPDSNTELVEVDGQKIEIVFEGETDQFAMHGQKRKHSRGRGRGGAKGRGRGGGKGFRLNKRLALRRRPAAHSPEAPPAPPPLPPPLQPPGDAWGCIGCTACHTACCTAATIAGTTATKPEGCEKTA